MQTEGKSLSPVDSFIASDVVKNFGKPPSQATEAVNAWTWTLSMPRSVRADLRIIGQFTKADVTRLKKQIQALEESFDEESNGTTVF